MPSMLKVSLGEECMSVAKEMQMKHNARYIIFKIENKEKVVIEKTGPAGESYDDFLGSLPPTECRYCLVDVDYITKAGAEHSKLVFIMWCPDDAGVKEKMLYSSSTDSMKDLKGVQCKMQGNDLGDIEKKAVQAKLI